MSVNHALQAPKTHARRLRDNANREVESTKYESELLVMNGMAYVTYVIALQFYRTLPQERPSYQPISGDSCAFLECWPIPHRYPRVSQHTAPSLPKRAIGLFVEGTRHLIWTSALDDCQERTANIGPL